MPSDAENLAGLTLLGAVTQPEFEAELPVMLVWYDCI